MFHNAFGTDKSLDNLFGDLVFEVCIFLIQKFSMFLSYESFLKKTQTFIFSFTRIPIKSKFSVAIFAYYSKYSI